MTMPYRIRLSFELLELLTKIVKRYQVEIHGYVLVGNRHHPQKRARKAMLSPGIV